MLRTVQNLKRKINGLNLMVEKTIGLNLFLEIDFQLFFTKDNYPIQLFCIL